MVFWFHPILTGRIEPKGAIYTAPCGSETITPPPTASFRQNLFFATSSDLHDLGFLASQHFVDFFDELGVTPVLGRGFRGIEGAASDERL